MLYLCALRHHEGSPRPLTPDRDPKEILRNLQKYGWREKNWPDLPYHLLIDLEGNIYEGRDIMKVGDTNTAYNPAGKLLIVVMGNTNVQAPNEKQLDSMTKLLAWASDYYNIDPATIRGHMEYTSTACPGKYLYPFSSSNSPLFLLTQGPLQETLGDYWRMVWELRSVTIVMMTKLEERTRIKCDQYWPSRGTETYGHITVTLQDVQELASYCIRTFLINKVSLSIV